jgi:gluconolactonase
VSGPPLASARVFYDGTLTEPRLDHPEGVAVHPDGSVWCGGEAGQLFRVDQQGRAAELVASTGGFILGIAFDAGGDLFACDIFHRAVFRLDGRSGALERFATGADGHRFTNPNYPAFDARGRLYVSDSHQPGDPGPAVFRFEPDGRGTVWYGGHLAFANGLALAPDGDALYVVESFLPGICRVAIAPDGSAGAREVVAELPGTVPDGIAFGPDGLLYVGCYEPSRVLRLDPDRPVGTVETVANDPTAHLLCHPTNLAFRGWTLFTANLGRWHLSAIELGERSSRPRDGGSPTVATDGTARLRPRRGRR